MMVASVIICTHNPIPDHINRTLLSLKNQSLNFDKWELLIVDNASNKQVATTVDISWHPLGRHLFEGKLGLTFARIKGIKEANGEVIIFVDDDNCLKENYLAILIRKMEAASMIGALGAGRIIPEFEIEPMPEVLPFLRSLALRDEKRAHFSNEVKYHKALPFGAGLGIRRKIALAFINTCLHCPVATTLGRIGEIVNSGDDINLALHACRDGHLAGVLPELELIHIIPKNRLTQQYLVKIAAGHAASSYLLAQLWRSEEYPEHPIIKWGRYWKNRLNSKGLARKILIAEYKAEKTAQHQWNALTIKPKIQF